MLCVDLTVEDDTRHCVASVDRVSMLKKSTGMYVAEI